jgi:hypothetical protein
MIPLNSRQVAMAINTTASEADALEAYDTPLYVRLDSGNLRRVVRVRLDEDCHVVLDLEQ